MSKETIIKAEKREVTGRGMVGRLRRGGVLPGVINNDKGESRLIQLNRHEFDMFLRNHRSESLILDVVLDGGKAVKLLLKEVQHHPVSDLILHVDFLEVSMTKKMRVTIPLKLVGDPYGVLNEGGVLDQHIRTVEVELLPGDMVEVIEVDVSAMKVGDAMRVKEIKVDPKLHILTNGSVAVANVSVPQVAEETPVEGEAAAAGPEVIGAKKEEEGAEGAEGKDKAAGDKKAPAGGDKKAPAGDKKAAAPGGDKKAPAKK